MLLKIVIVMVERGVLLVLTVKLTTRTYSYSSVNEEVMLEREEIMYVRTGVLDALDLVAETNSVVNEGDEYKLFKSGYRHLTTTFAEII